MTTLPRSPGRQSPIIDEARMRTRGAHLSNWRRRPVLGTSIASHGLRRPLGKAQEGSPPVARQRDGTTVSPLAWDHFGATSVDTAMMDDAVVRVKDRRLEG